MSCDPASKDDHPPNILILMADDAGWEDFGTYGNPHIQTPNIDAIARNGLQANNAFLTVAQCSPSRISIISGRYPHATGAEDLHMPMPDSLRILPAYLQERGYFTGYLKKGHFGPNGDKQFAWHSRDLNALNDFLDTAGERPFFMWVGFTDPHRPYKEGAFDPPQSPSNVNVPPYLIDDAATRRDLALYYDFIRRMDARIGDYMRTLKSRELLNNTLVIFLSDNGAPFPRAKGTVYDAGIKTPFVLQWPAKMAAGLQSDALISMIDLAPTLLTAVGMALPEQFQGRPIEGLLTDDDIVGREYIFSERNWHNADEHIRSVRSKHHKLIENAYIDKPFGWASDIGKSPSFKSLLGAKQAGTLNTAQALIFQVPRDQYEFYDLMNDPYELNNLINAPEHEKAIATLKSVLDDWKKDTGDFGPQLRRRKDNTDRFTGEKTDSARLPDWIE